MKYSIDRKQFSRKYKLLDKESCKDAALQSCSDDAKLSQKEEKLLFFNKKDGTNCQLHVQIL